MSPVDVGIIVFALAMAAIGWERGLARSALPLLGFMGGVYLGGRLAPSLLEGGSESRFAPAVAAAAGVLLGIFIAIALEGVGRGLSERLRDGTGTRFVDAIGGALLFVALALGAAWVFGAVALNIQGPNTREVRETVQRSSILTALNDALPPSGGLLNALRRIDPGRSIRGPEADVAAPDPKILEDPEVLAAASSVVRVRGSACGLGVEGTGWIAAPEVVVTNAHVVAGQDDTVVSPDGGSEIGVEVLHYEPKNDLAVLRAPGLAGAPLELDPQAKSGTPGAAAGYPLGGAFQLDPARLGRTGTVESQDSYGRGPVERVMAPFRGSVTNGNSGGPVVDGEGQVLTTIFASSVSKGPPSGLGVPNEIVAEALEGPLDGADTGPCAA